MGTSKAAQNRHLVAKYPNVYDFILHKLRHMAEFYSELGDFASAVIFDDVIKQYLAGDILVTFVDGEAYYTHIDVIEEDNNNNDLTV